MASPKALTSRSASTNTAPSGALSQASVVRSANRWRENYNPLRNLNLARAVALAEMYPRGEMAELQWTFMFVEEADPDLFALVERRTSAILEMDWNIKVVAKEKRRADFDQTLADEQAAALRDAYEGVDNLTEALEHLTLATFRGFSHCEKYRRTDGAVFHLEPVNQWNVVRDGLCGEWKYNPDAAAATFDSLPAAMVLAPADFLFRQVSRKVDRLGLLKFIRANLSEKDWDAFIEIYGIPGGVVIGPPNVPEGKAAEYETAARDIAEGGSGYIPHGSGYEPNAAPQGNNPFRDRLAHLSEKLILAGTGGMLTMLTAPTGLGSGTSDAHADVFASIARGEARRINECFQRGFDAEILAAAFPDEPVLAYFELAANEETDVGDIVTHALQLSQAGYALDPTELSEKTGYKLTAKPSAPVPPGARGASAKDTPDGDIPENPAPADAVDAADPLKNRGVVPSGTPAGPDAPDTGRLLAKARLGLTVATGEGFEPMRTALENVIARIQASDDPDAVEADLMKLDAALPHVLDQMNTGEPKSADEWEKIYGAAMASGLSVK